MTGVDYLQKTRPVKVEPSNTLDRYRRKLEAYAAANPENKAILKAIKGRWNIPPHMREMAMAVVDDIMDAGDTESQIRAVNALIQMDKANLDEEKMKTPIEINLNYSNMTDEEINKRIRELSGEGLKQLPR